VIVERGMDNVGVDDREFHPVANVFPLLEGDQFTALVEDIQTNGLHDSIVLHDGRIVDGRNRYRACQESGVTPRYQEWDRQGSLVAFVLSKNLYRRQLTAAQRSAVAVDLLPLLEEEGRERMAQGGRGGTRLRQEGDAMKKGSQDAMTAVETRPVEALEEGSELIHYLPPTPEQAAKSTQHAGHLTGVNERYVSYAKKVKRQAPDAFEALRAGTITMHQARAVAVAPQEERHALTAQVVTHNAKPKTERAQSPVLPVRPVRASRITKSEHARYQATVSRSLRALSWPALEALLEFAAEENMQTKTLLRLCRETRRDEEVQG